MDKYKLYKGGFKECQTQLDERLKVIEYAENRAKKLQQSAKRRRENYDRCMTENSSRRRSFRRSPRKSSKRKIRRSPPKSRSRKNKIGGTHLYKRLGVRKYATKQNIKNAYKKIKLKGKLTRKIKHAYRILSNNKRRKKYNQGYY
tara:strand:+ start:203 stop:637 length:435 start_codon:yes stop_codon:yes gene_type:complete